MTPTHRKTPAIAICLALMYTVASSTFLAQRIATTGFPPLRMAGIRFFVSGSLLYAALRARGAPAPSARQWGAAALSAIPLIVLGMGGNAVAVQRVPSGLCALIFASVPLWTAIFDRLWGGRLARVELAGLALGTLGVGLVSARGALRADSTAGIVLLVAAASHALGFVLTRRLPIPGGSLGMAAQMLSGGALLLAASVLAGEGATTPSRSSVLALAYVTFCGSMLVYSALGYLIRNARPALATSHAYVNPVVALGLGVTLGGERVTGTDLLGLCLVIAAVALAALGSRRRRAELESRAPALPRFDQIPE